MIFLLPVAAIFAYLVYSQKSEGEDMKKRLYDLKDVDPALQGGSFKKDYDIYFESAANEFKVPFALLKAHAIQESSLNPSAFLDENPKKLPERVGWASRGLMQILWWPGSERWKKYGYADKDLGFDGVLMFEPNINVRIAAQLIRDNLRSCSGNIRDAINMYNTGKKESVYAAPGNYTTKVYNNYLKIIGE